MRSFPRSRWPRRPKPPSTLDLIRGDKARELERRLCARPFESMEARGGDEFFEKQWPRMVRQACLHWSPQCLRLLVMLRHPHTGEPPPLPPRALGWLLEGREARTDASLPQGEFDAFFARVAQSPIVLSKDDGLRILRRGWGEDALGPLTYDHGPGPFAPAPTGQKRQIHPQLEAAWQAWCAKPSHIQAMLDLLAQAMGDQGLWRVEAGIDAFLDRIPEKRKAQVRQDLGEILLDTCWSSQSYDVVFARMLQWAKRFRDKGWALEHRAWKTWGEGTMDRFEHAIQGDEPPQAITKEADAWVKAMAHEDATLLAAIPGWRWTAGTEKMALWAMAQPFRKTLSSKNPNEFDWMDMLHSMKILERLEGNLVEMGWLEPNGPGWHEGIDSMMEPGWEEELERKRPINGTQQAAQFARKWNQWKARRMEATLPAPASSRPRARF